MSQDLEHCKMCLPIDCQGFYARMSESERAYLLKLVMRDAKFTMLGWVDTNLKSGLVCVVFSYRWTVLALKLGWVTSSTNAKRARALLVGCRERDQR